jgi:hypothetical protein
MEQVPVAQDQVPATSAGVNLPLKQLLISADRKGQDYFFASTLQFKAAQTPQDAAGLIRLSLMYLLRKGEVKGFPARIKALEVTEESSYVFVKGLKLSSGELKNIFDFMLISKFFNEKAE